MPKISNPFLLTEKQLKELFDSSYPIFPELEKVDIKKLLKTRQVKSILKTAKTIIDTLDDIPELSESLYRSFSETGERESYLKPHDARREKLSLAALLYLLGKSELKGTIENYLLAICEEHTWVVPPHEGRLIDLYTADTGLTLADVVSLVGNDLNSAVVQKVNTEIDKRIFQPYLNRTSEHKWYKNSDNWNSVCNSQIAATFLLIEKDANRKVHAIKTAFDSLEVYIETAFNNDGSTSEGIGYWNYGISWFVIFSEMLRASTNDSIDLLQLDRVKKIATYPSKIQLLNGMFVSFSDVNSDNLTFNPGIIQRLSDRTGEKSLLGLIVEPSELDYHGITSMLRYVLWWDGHTHISNPIEDSVLPDAGIVRLVNTTSSQTPVTIAIKAGHNGENHNHNDVGSFIVNIGGENFIADPGSGLYNKDYFSEKRYDNIFANSYGHSVPRINNNLQSTGEIFSGKLVGVDSSAEIKKVTIEFGKAYNVTDLKIAKRSLALSIKNKSSADLILEDEFEFFNNSSVIEEAFITWLDVEVNGKIAVIHGQHHDLILTVSEPNISGFQAEVLERQSKENKKNAILRRISLIILASENRKTIFRMEIKIRNTNI
jgi:hypothetical protein